jgi:hypothetical protein
MLKVFRGFWFLSFLAVFASLLYVYAGLPEDVLIQDDLQERIIVSKETLFYIGLFLLLFINVLVYVVSKLAPQNEGLRTWFHGLISTLNLFLIISLFLVNAVNSGEKFNFQNIEFIIYGSLVLILLWAMSWPVILSLRKFSDKQLV